MAGGNLAFKHAMFAAEFVRIGNATKSAIAAGYSEKTAAQIGYKLLQRDDVKAEIKRLQENALEAAGISTVMLLDQLKRIAMADLREFVEWGPRGVTLVASVDVDGQVVAEVSETVTEAGGSKRIKLHDKLGAIDRICRIGGLYAPEKKQVQADVNGLAELLALAFDDEETGESAAEEVAE